MAHTGFKRMPSQPHARQLLVVHDSDERREVSLERREGGGMILTERCSGDLTQALFGTSERAGRVVLESREAVSVGVVLGLSGEAVADWPLRFFHDESVFLSDLLDLLDHVGIGYAFVATSEDGIAYRAAASTQIPATAEHFPKSQWHPLHQRTSVQRMPV